MVRGFKQTFARPRAGLRLDAALAVSLERRRRAHRVARRPQRPPIARCHAVGEPTRAPIGWVEFCVEYKGECETKPSTPRDVVLTTKAWSDLVKVNDWVNNSIQPMTDLDHWGVVERWNYPDDGKGDCEDYVLLKRRMLMQAGWPREALLITVVRDKKARATPSSRSRPIAASSSSIIRNPKSCPGTETGYRFVKRQSQSDPNVWVTLGEPRRAGDSLGTLVFYPTSLELIEQQRNSRPRSRPHPSPSPDRVRERPSLPQGRPHPFWAGNFHVKISKSRSRCGPTADAFARTLMPRGRMIERSVAS